MTTLTSIPPVKSLKNRKTLAELRKEFVKFLDDELIGQPKAKATALRIFNLIYSPLREPNKPIFTAGLAGQSRTGKTLLVKLFAKWFHGREDAMVRIDGGEFLDKHYISRVIGAPPSYIGYKDPKDTKEPLKPEDVDQSAMLSQHNLNRSKLGSDNDVVFLLLDEFEKFPQEIISLLLKGLDDGEATLANNTKINLRNVVIFFTANLGMRELSNRIFGFNRSSDSREEIVDAVQGAYKQFTTPEFRNRVDEIIVYESLGEDDLLKIVGVETRRLNKFITETKTLPLFEVNVTKEAAKKILELTLAGEGNLGNMKRVMQQHVREKLGDMVNDGVIKTGMRIDVVVVDGAITLVPVADAMKIADMLTLRQGKETLPPANYEALLTTRTPDEVVPIVSRVLGILAEANVTVESSEFSQEGSVYTVRLFFAANSAVIEKLNDGLTGQAIRFLKLSESVERFLVFISNENLASIKATRWQEYSELLNEAGARFIKSGGVSDKVNWTHYELAAPASKFATIENRLKTLGFQSIRRKEAADK